MRPAAAKKTGNLAASQLPVAKSSSTPTPVILGPEVSAVGFSPGTTIASLPGRKDGPVGLPCWTYLALMLTHAGVPPTLFKCYIELGCGLSSLFPTNISEPGSPVLYRVGLAFHQSDGVWGAKKKPLLGM